MLIIHVFHKYMTHIHRKMGQEKKFISLEDMHKLRGLFSLVVFVCLFLFVCFQILGLILNLEHKECRTSSAVLCP